MIHSKDEVLKVANTLSKKLIELCPKVHEELGNDNDILLHELDSIIAMARCVTADMSDFYE